jgi:hypothetical protein
MITGEQLQQSSTKAGLLLALADATTKGWLALFNEEWRQPDTIVSGVLTVEAADKLWADPNQVLLVHACGMCFWDDGKAVFMTDDSQYGGRVLNERGWVACSFRFRGTNFTEFGGFADMLRHYYKNYRLLSSEQELLDYLNGATST